MSVNIVDNFNLNSELPIDKRIIASNSTVRDAIRYKYDGLKVFLLDTRETWVWNKSTATWETESNIGSGTPNRVVKWNNSGSSLSHTSMSSTPQSVNEINQKVGIGTDAKEAFQVDGNYSASYSTSVFGTSSQPFVIHKGASTILGDNWWLQPGVGNRAFDTKFASSTIKFNKGGFVFSGRTASTIESYLNTLLTINSDSSITFSPVTQPIGATNGVAYFDVNTGKFNFRESDVWKQLASMSLQQVTTVGNTSSNSIWLTGTGSNGLKLGEYGSTYSALITTSDNKSLDIYFNPINSTSKISFKTVTDKTYGSISPVVSNEMAYFSVLTEEPYILHTKFQLGNDTSLVQSGFQNGYEVDSSSGMFISKSDGYSIYKSYVYANSTLTSDVYLYLPDGTSGTNLVSSVNGITASSNGDIVISSGSGATGPLGPNSLIFKKLSGDAGGLSASGIWTSDGPFDSLTEIYISKTSYLGYSGLTASYQNADTWLQGISVGSVIQVVNMSDYTSFTICVVDSINLHDQYVKFNVSVLSGNGTYVEHGYNSISYVTSLNLRPRSSVIRLSQSGTSAPTVDYILLDQLNLGSISTSYDGVGIYSVNFTSFTMSIAQQSYCTANLIKNNDYLRDSVVIIDGSSIHIHCKDYDGSFLNGVLYSTALEIKYYG